MAVLPRLVWRPSPNKSSRHGRRIELVTVHDTEGAYAGSVAWLCNPRAEASATVVLREDGEEATQLVSEADKAWHCMNYNSLSLGLEIAGSSRKGYPDKQLRVAARIVAFWLHKHGLPPKHVRPRFPGDGSRGFTYHSDLGAAGGGHSDPGFSKVRSLWFDALVKYEYRRGGFRKDWTR